MKKSLAILFLILISISCFSQKDPAWDDTSKSKWDSNFKEVDIPSSADGKIQKAFVYKSKSKAPKPLIVSLHTWSGDYTQKDPINKEILARDWNYIHPNFRGANNKPEAMGSPLVISDIEDAIRYAVDYTNADPSEVHIIGTSGGGYATLLAYMNIKYPVKSFSAWAPISDIEAWYWESVGRNQKYAKDILNALGKNNAFDKEEALKRSPLVHAYPRDLRKGAKLYIYEGIHDGYKGSVPITHSINMYNRLVGELRYETSDLDKIAYQALSDSNLVSDKEIINLVTKRINPKYNPEQSLFGRNIYLFREYEDIQLTVFEGGHEQIPQALALIPYQQTEDLQYNILTIGDSNGNNKGGWVDQLKAMLPQSKIVNNSKGGRTIGFDNNGRKELNGLHMIDKFLDSAQGAIDSPYDFVIVCLGTNDTKKEFDERQGEVPSNFEKLLEKIKNHQLSKKSTPKFIFVTPPPIRVKDIAEKYEGGNDRLKRLVPQLKTIAEQKGFEVLDIFNPLQGVFDYYAPDGVHMEKYGQEIIASQIVEKLK